MTPEEQMRGEYKSIAEIVDELMKNGDEDMKIIVERWRKNVVFEIADAGKLDPMTVEVLRQRLSALSDDVYLKLYKVMTENQRRLFIKGIQSVDRILTAGHIRALVPFLTETKLQQLQNFVAGEIRGLTDLAKKKISTELTMAMMGQKPTTEVLDAIGRNLDSPSIFGTIQARSRAIFITEVNRVNNIAAVDRMKQVATQVPDLMKEWRHSHVGVPRPFHFALHGVRIPALQKFTITSADGEEYQIEAPHDPILPVGEVVNCRCRAVPVVGRYVKD
jgi:hypothetical protein